MMIKDLPNDEYHKRPEISKTQLDLFHDDQYALEWQKKAPVDEDKLKTLDFGDATHAICLEPDRLKNEFTTMPDEFQGITCIGQTNVAKEARAAFESENSDKKILSILDYKKLNLMFESVMAHPQARAHIEAIGLAESSWFWTDTDTGVKCRCRPDKLIGNLLVDIKTTPELVKFKYSVDDYRYFVQDPFYCDGLAANGIDEPEFEFLVIQKNINCGRYPVMVKRLPEDVVEYGRALYKQDLEAYARYLDGHREPTMELEMAPRFYVDLDETLSEVKI